MEEKDKWGQERRFQGITSKLLLLKAKITKIKQPFITFLTIKKHLKHTHTHTHTRIYRNIRGNSYNCKDIPIFCAKNRTQIKTFVSGSSSSGLNRCLSHRMHRAGDMDSSKRCAACILLLSFTFIFSVSYLQRGEAGVDATQTASLFLNASQIPARKIPQRMFGISFEEINHSGAGGLWAELVSNRGFEAGGPNTPSNISPWTIIGNETSILVSTDRSSCFDRNKVALQVEVFCHIDGGNVCPAGGVGVYNPGYWGMNVEKGKRYRVTFYVRALQPIELSVSFIGSKMQTLATSDVKDEYVTKWKKKEVILEAHGSDTNSRLQLTTSKRSTIWLDQVSAIPLDTHKGHGFRQDLFDMLAALKPGFIRFPGGSFVEGDRLMNAFRWRETIGTWEERPGHFNDVWQYWTDDGLGFFEFLQLAEDLGASPVWVFNIGISRNDQVDSSLISPFVQDTLDAIEFARGDTGSLLGSVRAAMGHPQPFDLKHVAAGNQDCWNKNYRGNYIKFHNAIKGAYPDIKIITNCDGSVGPLDHPADLYDYHVYTNANSMFSMAHTFDHTSRSGPKAFVSEYDVTGNEAGRGNLLKALAEAGFLIGLEKNSDAVEMASNAPLFVNANDQRFNPDAIVFDSSKVYGTPSYWMQQFFKDSNGATLLDSTLQSASSSLTASAISWTSPQSYIRIKVVNFGGDRVNLKLSVEGLDKKSIEVAGCKLTTLTSNDLKDENSFNNPKKVAPVVKAIKNASNKMNVILPPYSLTSIDFKRKSNVIEVQGSNAAYASL